mgnify:CR=1 FL=1
MKIIKRMISAPREAEYEDIRAYDNLDDYVTDYGNQHGRDFVRVGFGDWRKEEINGNTYYHFRYDDMYLTEDVYKELLDHCEKTYSIHEHRLERTQRGSNTRVTGELPSVEAVLDYMKNSAGSWLPQVFKEIDEDIAALQKKIDHLNNIKATLQDEEYLKSKIETEYTFDSAKYFASKEAQK